MHRRRDFSLGKRSACPQHPCSPASLSSALPSYLDKIRVSVLLSYVNLLFFFFNIHYEALLSILDLLCVYFLSLFFKSILKSDFWTHLLTLYGFELNSGVGLWG